jgi:hypothetical protein
MLTEDHSDTLWSLLALALACGNLLSPLTPSTPASLSWTGVTPWKAWEWSQ